VRFDPSCQRGFTLAEVMVAFAIFALAAAAVFEVFAGATRRAQNAGDRERALLIAQSVLSELRANPFPWREEIKGRASSGEAWRASVQPFDAGTDPAHPWRAYAVGVTVAMDGAGHEFTLHSLELGRNSR
jgi:type II secretion system protein I